MAGKIGDATQRDRRWRSLQKYERGGYRNIVLIGDREPDVLCDEADPGGSVKSGRKKRG